MERTKDFANQLIHAIEQDPKLDTVDSTDNEVQQVGDSYVFRAYSAVDRIIPGRRGPGSRVPVGQVTYTVTITAHSERFGEDDKTS